MIAIFKKFSEMEETNNTFNYTYIFLTNFFHKGVRKREKGRIFIVGDGPCLPTRSEGGNGTEGIPLYMRLYSTITIRSDFLFFFSSFCGCSSFLHNPIIHIKDRMRRVVKGG